MTQRRRTKIDNIWSMEGKGSMIKDRKIMEEEVVGQKDVQSSAMGEEVEVKSHRGHRRWGRSGGIKVILAAIDGRRKWSDQNIEEERLWGWSRGFKVQARHCDGWEDWCV